MDNIPQHLLTQETRQESYEAVKHDAAARRRVILEILAERGGMTAREVAGELHRRGITNAHNLRKVSKKNKKGEQSRQKDLTEQKSPQN